MTTFSDNFNRSNETLQTSSDWDAILQTFEIVSNVVECQTNDDNCVAEVNTTAANFNDDQECECDIGNLTNNNWVGLAIRAQTPNGGCYTLVNDGTTNTGQLYRLDNDGGVTTLGNDFTLANGDTITLNATGTTIAASVNDSEEESVTDATFSDGQPGLYGYNGDSGSETTVDDYEATDEFGAGGTSPKGPLTHPLYGPFRGPIA